MSDRSGKLYGTTSTSGSNDAGTVFELTPSGGGWTFCVLYSLTGFATGCGTGSATNLVMDAAGNLYGMIETGGAYGYGSVFKLTPSNGSWLYSSIHDFAYNDGTNPWSTLVMDASGNIYGTTVYGGMYGRGTVWEITP